MGATDDNQRVAAGPPPRWIYSIAAALFLAGVGGGLGAWSTVNVLSSQVADINAWRNGPFFSAPRYTPENAATDREACAERTAVERRARTAADSYLVGQISAIQSEILDCKRYRESDGIKGEARDQRLKQLERDTHRHSK